MITISWVTVAKIAVFTAIAMTIINLILKRKSGGYVGYALLWLLLVKWAILPSINIPEIYLIITRLVFGILLSFVITVKIRCYSQIDREIMQAAGKNKELIIKG